MPELPEAETLRRQLEQVICGKKIKGISIFDNKLGAPPPVGGRTVSRLAREGKGLKIGLDDGGVISIHLRMTGRLLWRTGKTEPFSHTRFTVDFPKGYLDLIDPRRFATLELDKDAANKGAPGMDPLHGFEPAILEELGRQRKMPVKTFLMDQRFIAGIGNIYACEILYGAAIDPGRRVCDVGAEEWRRIGPVTAGVLAEAVACRGTTVSDWRDLFGEKGEYQHRLKVYGKEGMPCPRCGVPVEWIKMGGRGTYYCPSCQV